MQNVLIFFFISVISVTFSPRPLIDKAQHLTQTNNRLSLPLIEFTELIGTVMVG